MPDKNTHVSSDVKAEPFAPLPRGRHNLPLSVVRASQRERLLHAMLECVADRGYEATTVPGVVAAAKVSRNAFYALFADKADCFLALCDELAGEVLESMLESSPELAAAGAEQGNGNGSPAALDEAVSPVAGRRFSRS